HAGGIRLHWLIDELFELGEVENLFEAARRLGADDTHVRQTRKDVLAAREVRMEPGADLQERTDAAAELQRTARRARCPGDQLEERTLPGSVAPDDRDLFAGPDRQVQRMERHMFRVVPG